MLGGARVRAAGGGGGLTAATLQLLPLVTGRAATAIKRGGRSEAVCAARLLASTAAALAAGGAGHAVAACGTADVLAHVARAALLDAVLRREAPEAVVAGVGAAPGAAAHAAPPRRRVRSPWAALPRTASAASLAADDVSSADECSSSDDGRRSPRSAAGASSASAASSLDDDDAADGPTWSECGSPPRRDAAAAARRAAARAARAAARREAVVAGAEYEVLDIMTSVAALAGASLALDCGIAASGLLSVAAAAAPPAWDGGDAAPPSPHADAVKAAFVRLVLALLDSLGWEFADARAVELWCARALARSLAPGRDRFRGYAAAMASLSARFDDGGAKGAGLPPVADWRDPLPVVAAAAAALVRLFRSPTPARRTALALAAPGYEHASAAARRAGALVGCAHYACGRVDGVADGAAARVACPDCGVTAYCSPACRAAHAPDHAAACMDEEQGGRQAA